MEIYYIGGSPCSGKSTLAEMLAAEYGFVYYKLDDHLFAYMQHAADDGKPISAMQLSMDAERMWMRDPQLQADEEIAMYDEIFPYALLDLGRLEAKGPVITEGAGYMPRLMHMRSITPGRYICIVPSDAFQRENYSKRTWIGQFLSGCTDPQAAFDNWMSRDALFAKEMLRQAQQFEYSSILVDGAQSIQDNYRVVERAFGLTPAEE